MAKIRVTQVRSGVSHKSEQQLTLVALGFHRINQSVVHEDSQSLRGMISTVRHLVKVEEASDQAG